MSLLTLDLISSCPAGPDDGRAPALRAFVEGNRGRELEIGWPYQEKLVVGDAGYFGLDFGTDSLRRFPCVRKCFDLVFVGAVTLSRVVSRDEGWRFYVISSSGGRVYAYGERSRLLYIVSESGFDDVVTCYRGFRTVFEIYDIPLLDAKDECLEFGYECSPITRPIMEGSCGRARLLEFLFGHPRLTCESCCDPEGYFMFGSESQLNLAQYLPTRVFYCLRAAGYRVLGQGYRLSVILFNDKCEVFVLLRGGYVMKVANTVRAFVRDRLQYCMTVKKYAFAADGVDDLCVGDVIRFPCDVKYTLQCDDWFIDRLRFAKNEYMENETRSERHIFVS